MLSRILSSSIRLLTDTVACAIGVRFISAYTYSGHGPNPGSLHSVATCGCVLLWLEANLRVLSILPEPQKTPNYYPPRSTRIAPITRD
jgi:hypothetical protein